MALLGQMVLKGVNWVHSDKIRSNGLERSQLCTHLQRLGQMVLKGVNCSTQLQKSSYRVLKGVNWVQQ